MERRKRNEEFLDLRQRFPPRKDFKLGEGNSDLRFVVWISEVFGILLVKLRGELLIWMDRKRKSLGYRKYLEGLG